MEDADLPSPPKKLKKDEEVLNQAQIVKFSIADGGGWTVRRLITENYCCKLSLVKSGCHRELIGKWLLDGKNPRVILATSGHVDEGSGDHAGDTTLFFEKVMRAAKASKDKAAPSVNRAMKLPLPADGWRVKDLEVTEGQMYLDLYLSMNAFDFKGGGEVWEFCEKEDQLSVALDSTQEHEQQACISGERLPFDAPLNFKRAPPPPSIHTLCDEMMLKVFGLFSLFELVVLGRVDRRWNRIAKDNKLWKDQELVFTYDNVIRAKEVARFGGTALKSVHFEDFSGELLMFLAEHCPGLERVRGVDVGYSWITNVGVKEKLELWQNLTELSVEGYSKKWMLELLTGRFNSLTKLDISHIGELSPQELGQILQGKPSLTSFTTDLAQVNPSKLDVVLQACGPTLKEIDGVDADETVTADHPLFELPLEVLGMRIADPGCTPAIARLSGTLKKLKLAIEDIEVELTWAEVLESIGALAQVFGTNTFRSLECLELSILSDLDVGPEAVPLLPLLLKILSGAPSLETLEFHFGTPGGTWPSLTEIVSSVGARCPGLRKLSIGISETIPEGRRDTCYWNLFKDPRFLPNLEEFGGVSSQAEEDLLRLIRPRIKKILPIY